MDIKFDTKFTEKEIDEFINGIFLNHQSNPHDNYYFDFTEVEFIGNQELLIFSGLLKSFVESNIYFRIKFIEEGVAIGVKTDRMKIQIIQLWRVWRIWEIIPVGKSIEYFGIDVGTVERFERELNYFPKSSEIFTRYGVTPFIQLKYINNYDATLIKEKIKPIYNLDSAIKELLRNSNCSHPFTSNSLNTIITEELYLNFLDHSSISSFIGFERFCFMSIAFQDKLRVTEKRSLADIQNLKKYNFETEGILETRNFFYDNTKKEYKNEPYVQFSFLDFGAGIVGTLKEQYILQNEVSNEIVDDSDVLRFAFEHNTSRHPILNKDSKPDQFIPRGLFDALIVVKRYKGMLVIRSNYGKILFDFSTEANTKKAYSAFGNNKQYFPGTLITLYIPASQKNTTLNKSTIKPEIEFFEIKPENKKYISINSLIEQLQLGKESLYNNLLIGLKNAIVNRNKYSLVFLSFKNSDYIPKYILKKTLYFLLTDYDINNKSNVVIIDSPPLQIIKEIEAEIIELNKAIKNYKIHPLPIISHNKITNDISLKWLGVYDVDDIERLNNLLLEGFSIARSDFMDPDNVIGHLNYFDKFGNLKSNLPNKSELINILYKNQSDKLYLSGIEWLLKKYGCIKTDDHKKIFLCNGNYYQHQYVVLSDLINNKVYCEMLSNLLFEKIRNVNLVISDCRFIGITATCHKILRSFVKQGFIKKEQCIPLDSYHGFEEEIKLEKTDLDKSYLLICDVASTGGLTLRLDKRLRGLGVVSGISHVAVIVSILHDGYNVTRSFQEEFQDKLISLYDYPIPKYSRDEILDEITKKEIVRINPYTNIPITLSINETNYKETVIYNTTVVYNEERSEIKVENKFLDIVNDEFINIGFLKFNNLIHPYFFNAEKILAGISENTLKYIFKNIGDKDLEVEKNIKIFYPRKSGVEKFNFKFLQQALSNEIFEEVEVERFTTREGWRFPHNSDDLGANIHNNICLVLDDGSCSGDSLIQMIDEISFYDAKKIVLLCFIGRVDDHKREFFSRLSSIKVSNKKVISLAIYFASHWHIPTYYLDDNPNTKEIAWLNKVMEIQNTPQSIKKIADRISKEISPKEMENFRDYKYLPPIKSQLKIPKKDLLLVREELGKVIGYRFYKEGFYYFNYFAKKYAEREWKAGRYKEIELLCAIFIYEPYLYEKILRILPDIVERIEGFVRVLIFGNKSGKKIEFEQLTYDWVKDKKNIVHLFFIVFKDKKLVSELTSLRFKELIEFTLPKESALNYVLYKLLSYFPFSKDEVKVKRYSSKILAKIDSIISDNKESNMNQIKKFNSFLLTLPSSNSFSDSIFKIQEGYRKILDEKYHNDNIEYYLGTISIKIEYLINEYSNEVVKEIVDNWINGVKVIEQVLEFHLNFPEFFTILSNDDNRLIDNYRSILGEVSDIIFGINQKTNFEELEGLISSHISAIFKQSSNFYKTFVLVQCNLESTILGFINTLEIKYNAASVKHNIVLGKVTNILIPNFIFKEIVLFEIVGNFRWCDFNQPIEVTIEYLQDSNVVLTIRNHSQNKNSEKLKGNGKGTERIKLINLFPDDLIKYENNKDQAIYIQTLKIKTI